MKPGMANAPFRAVTLLSDTQCADLMALITSCQTRNASGCKLVDVRRSSRLSQNEKGYVQLKVPYECNHRLEEFRSARACTNKKVQLHQLVMWMHQEDGLHPYRKDIAAGKLELSHLCHNKCCANPMHLVPETSSINKSRSYCEVVVKVNGALANICRHVPRCIATEDKVSNAVQIEM